MPARKKGTIEITEGSLGDYSTHMTIKERRDILRKVIRKEMRTRKMDERESALAIMRALIARANLTINNAPTASGRFKRDANWVRREYLDKYR